MTEEFKKARYKKIMDIFEPGQVYFQMGTDWAYEWCEKEMVPGTMKVVFKKKAEIEKQQAIIDRLKEGLDDIADICSPKTLKNEGNPAIDCFHLVVKALADVEKMRK